MHWTTVLDWITGLTFNLEKKGQNRKEKAQYVCVGRRESEED